MNIITVDKDTIFFQNSEYKLDDLYTSEFYHYSDQRCDEFKNETILVNSLFEFILHPFLAVTFFLKDKDINEIDIQKAGNLLRPLLCDYAISHNIHVKGNNPSVLLSHIKSNFILLLSAVYLAYLMFRIPQNGDGLHEKEFSIIRSNAAKSKMRRFSFRKEYENPKDRNSVYRLYSRAERLKWVLAAVLMASKELSKLRELTERYAGQYTTILLDRYCEKRLVHSFLYFKLIDKVFSENPGCNFYTGNNIDRFSVIEDKASKKYGLHTFCIPHGLEYGFKLPKGFSCDIFYTTSQRAAGYFNRLYSTDKFHFDSEVIAKMYKVDKCSCDADKKVVFFTESREVWVNVDIIEKIVPMLLRSNIKLYLKLHPKDNLHHYKDFGDKVAFIDKLEDALCSNICFARKSTTLIEAVYNGSSAAAIILNPKDKAVFSTFPSLQDEKLNVFYDTNDLFEWIRKEMAVS